MNEWKNGIVGAPVHTRNNLHPAKGAGDHAVVPGFCASARLDKVRTPGRYVGLPDEEGVFDFNDRFAALTKELAEQMREEERLNACISENLAKIAAP
ncbi:MAG: hypothetical protein SFV52_10850 [Saprospiraceae bacterium]|nr:hypothetical protein [Saprospiraceae bacterium]